MTFLLSCATHTTSLVSVFIPSLTSLGWGASQPGGEHLRQPLPRQAADSYDDAGRCFLNSPTLTCGTIIWNKIKKRNSNKEWVGCEIRPHWWYQDGFLAWNTATDVSWFFFQSLGNNQWFWTVTRAGYSVCHKQLPSRFFFFSFKEKSHSDICHPEYGKEAKLRLILKFASKRINWEWDEFVCMWVRVGKEC